MSNPILDSAASQVFSQTDLTYLDDPTSALKLSYGMPRWNMMESILRSPTTKRSAKQIEFLLNEFIHFPLFASYIKDGYKHVLRGLLQYVQYAEFQEGESIYAKDDDPLNFYMILRGTVCLYNTDMANISKRQVKSSAMRELGEGEHFGGLEILLEKKRLFTAIVSNPALIPSSEPALSLIRVDKIIFDRLLRTIEAQTLDQDLTFLENVNIFSKWDRIDLVNIYVDCVKRNFDAHEPVYRCGDTSDTIYIVKSGSFSMYKQRQMWGKQNLMFSNDGLESQARNNEEMNAGYSQKQKQHPNTPHQIQSQQPHHSSHIQENMAQYQLMNRLHPLDIFGFEDILLNQQRSCRVSCDGETHRNQFHSTTITQSTGTQPIEITVTSPPNNLLGVGSAAATVPPPPIGELIVISKHSFITQILSHPDIKNHLIQKTKMQGLRPQKFNDDRQLFPSDLLTNPSMKSFAGSSGSASLSSSPGKPAVNRSIRSSEVAHLGPAGVVATHTGTPTTMNTTAYKQRSSTALSIGSFELPNLPQSSVQLAMNSKLQGQPASISAGVSFSSSPTKERSILRNQLRSNNDLTQTVLTNPQTKPKTVQQLFTKLPQNSRIGSYKQEKHEDSLKLQISVNYINRATIAYQRLFFKPTDQQTQINTFDSPKKQNKSDSNNSLGQSDLKHMKKDEIQSGNIPTQIEQQNIKYETQSQKEVGRGDSGNNFFPRNISTSPVKNERGQLMSSGGITTQSSLWLKKNRSAQAIGLLSGKKTETTFRNGEESQGSPLFFQSSLYETGNDFETGQQKQLHLSSKRFNNGLMNLISLTDQKFRTSTQAMGSTYKSGSGSFYNTGSGNISPFLLQSPLKRLSLHKLM